MANGLGLRQRKEGGGEIVRTDKCILKYVVLGYAIDIHHHFHDWLVDLCHWCMGRG